MDIFIDTSKAEYLTLSQLEVAVFDRLNVDCERTLTIVPWKRQSCGGRRTVMICCSVIYDLQRQKQALIVESRCLFSFAISTRQSYLFPLSKKRISVFAAAAGILNGIPSFISDEAAPPRSLAGRAGKRSTEKARDGFRGIGVRLSACGVMPFTFAVINCQNRRADLTSTLP